MVVFPNFSQFMEQISVTSKDLILKVDNYMDSLTSSLILKVHYMLMADEIFWGFEIFSPIFFMLGGQMSLNFQSNVLR